MLSPHDIGLPTKFVEWQTGQEGIITHMLYPRAHYTTLSVPTGNGKTVCYVASALVSGKRTLILTSTKGLQDQLKTEFGSMVTVVKGQSSYKCRLSNDKYTCNTGSCHWGFKCPFKTAQGDDMCRYQRALKDGLSAKIVVTNYSFWVSNSPEILGEFKLLIMDEAHDAAEHLLGALSMEIKREEVRNLIKWIPEGCSTSQYYEWAKVLKGIVDDTVKKSGGVEKRGSYHILTLQQKLNLLSLIWMDNWVVEHKGNSISWDVIWPAPLAQSYLFRGIPHVILTSATVTKADMIMLGIGEREYTFDEYPSSIPVANRPIYFIPTTRMDRFITTAGMNAWAARIDNIIGSRLAYKGIIHTVSYDRADRVCNFSQYKDFMMGHKGKTTAETIVRFKTADPPSILVSPSVVTGYDFPHEEARYQIIGKVPFMDGRPLVVKARQKVNQDYGCYMALKQLVQATGRISRTSQDWGETFVIDNHFQWIISKYRGILPKWWIDSIRTVNIIPKSR